MNLSLTLNRYFRRSGLLCRIRFGVRIPNRVIPSLWDQTTPLLRDSLKTHIQPNIRVLEMGTGQSALLLCWLAGAYPQHGLTLLGAEINPHFAENARIVAASNLAPVEIIESDLFSRIDGQFNIIFMNPPYVPKDHPAAPKEGTAPLDTTWDGGTEGTDVIDDFLGVAHEYLTNDGLVLLGVNRFYVPSEETEKLIAANGYTVRQTVEKPGNQSVVYVLGFAGK